MEKRKMCLIGAKYYKQFTNDKLRLALIEKGKKQLQKFSWDTTASQLWHSIQEVSQNSDEAIL
jgi:hypothetical protein